MGALRSTKRPQQREFGNGQGNDVGFIENIVISITKFKLRKSLHMGDVKEISSEGLKEYRDVPYYNRSGKELLMDIFEPIVAEGTELPVIVNIHGGGLIGGSKNLSAGFCRQLAKRGYLVFSPGRIA